MKKPTALPSQKLQAIVEQLDAFTDEYMTLDVSDIQQAAAELESYAGCLECEGL